MSRKRKTKNRNKTGKMKAKKPEIVIHEVEMGGAGSEKTEVIGDEAGAVGEATNGVGASRVAAETDDEGAEIEEVEEMATAESGAEVVAEGTAEEGGGDDAKQGKLERKKGGWLHRTNIYYPWLKFVVVAVFAVGLVFGGFGVGRIIRDTVWETIEAPKTTELEGDEPENTEVGEKPAEGVEGGSTGDGSGEGGSTENGSTEERPQGDPTDKPAVTTKPPVTVPPTGGKKLVALTFDDGPSTVTTGRLLDILKSKGVKATFFVVGSMVDRAPDLLRREIAEGHEVGSHSSFHQDLSKLTAADLQADVANMDRIFTEVLGRKVEIMRPPYGAVSEVMRGYLGKPMIYWSVDPEDWKYRNAATVRANVVGATFDGAVVLMHDIHSSTVDAVAGIIDDLRAQGYEFLTVSELAAARGIGLTSGVVYYSFKP